MKVIFCTPELTMKEIKNAIEFFDKCKEILDVYVANKLYVSTPFQINQLLTEEADENDILVFFTSENGEYTSLILKLICKYNDAKSRIWAVAMQNNPECRKPPEPVSEKQSYDVSCRNENSQMNKTYSPWIYSEIICTQIVRKKPLFMYRNYISKRFSFDTLYESTQFIMHNAISYTVSLNHLKPLKENDLSKWEDEYTNNRQRYEYALDALYKFICPDEVRNTKNMFAVLKEDELGTLKHAYSAKDMDMKERENAENVLSKIIRRCMPCCVDCDNRGRMFKG